MSNTVENRVVQMKFDNKSFEKNVKETLKSLEKLKEGLDLEKAVSHIENIDKAFSAIPFQKIADSVESLADRFSFLGNIAYKALDRVADKIVDTGMSLGKQLSIDTMTTGLSKYEQEVKAIQTITAATGQSVKDIEPYVQELMWYSDETSYSFNDMIDNVGKFVSAGVDLERAVKAVQGISSEAARSGAGIQEANRAMYNFAQSIAQGSVKLMDWKSIENANMATKEFKEELIKTAKEMGTLTKAGKVNVKGKKKLEVTTQNFNQTLSSEWLTTEVLIETLNRYADTTTEIGAASFKAAKETKTATEMFEYLKDSISSGWMQSFKYVIGDYEEATKLWSAVADEFGEIFGELSEKRNETLRMWKNYGGRFFLLDGIKKYWEGFRQIFSAISEGWHEIFPELHWTDLRRACDTFRDYATQFKKAFSDETEDGTRRLDDFFAIARGVASIIQMVGKVLKPFKDIFAKIFLDLFDPALDGLANFGDWLYELNNSIDNSTFFQTLVDGFMVLADIFISVLPGALGAVKDLFVGVYTWLDDHGIIQDVAQAWLNLTTGLAYRIPLIIEILKDLGEGIKYSFSGDGRIGKFIAAFKQKLDPFIQWFKGFANTFKWCLTLFLYTDTSEDKSLGEKLKHRFSQFKPLLDYVTGTFKEQYDKFLADHPKIAAFIAKLKGIFDLIKQKLGIVNLGDLKAKGAGIITNLKGYFSKLGEFFQTFAANNPITRGATAFKNWITTNLNLQSIKTALIDFAQKIMEKISGFISFVRAHFTIQEIAEFAKLIASTATAFATLGMIRNISKFFKSFAGVGESLSETIESFQKGGAKQNFSQKFLNIAAGIAIIVGAMYVLSKMSDEDVAKAKDTLFQIGIALTAMTFVMGKFNSKGSGGIKDMGVGILAAAAGMFILYKTLTKFMELDPQKALKGLGLMGILFLELGVFMRLAGGNSLKKDNKFLQLAIALNLMLIPIMVLGNMDNGVLLKGIGSLGVLMLMIGLLSRATSGDSMWHTNDNRFLSMAVALTLLLVPITILGNMKTKNLVKGVGAISILLGVMALAAKASQGQKMGGLVAFAVVLGLLMGAFALVLKYTKDSQLDQMLGFAAGLSALILSMAVAMKLIQGNNDLLAGAKIAINLLEFILIMGVAMLAVGAIFNKFDKEGGLLEAIEKGGLVFEKIGEGIGRFVKGIVTGLFGRADAQIDELIVLGGGLQEYANTVDGLNTTAIETSISAIKMLGEAAAAIPRVGGIVGALLGDHDVGKFANDLPALGSGIASFADAVKNVDAGHVTAVGSSMQVIAKLTDMVPKTGGLFNWIADGLFGVTDYDKFTQDMVSLGGAIVAFADTTSGVDAGTVEGVANAALAITALTDIVPKEGGFFNWLSEKLFGTQNYNQFTSDLITLGYGISEFAKTVKDVDANTITKVSNAALALTALNDNVPPTGGKLQQWLGEKDLGHFGDSLIPLGTGISNFAQTVKGLKTDDIEKAGNSAMVLATLANQIPSTGGALQRWLGEKDLTVFGNNLPVLGDSLTKFATSVKGLDTDSIEKAKGSAGGLAALANAIPANGGWLQSVLGTKDLADFGGQLGALGTGLHDFAVNSGGVSETDISAATTILSDLASLGVDIIQFNTTYDIESFGIKLAGLGEKLEAFSNRCTNVNIPVTTSAVEMIATLSRLAKEFDGVKLTNGVDNLKKVFGSLATESNGIGTSAAAIAGDFLYGFGTQFQNGSDSVKDLLSICGDFVTTLVQDMKTEENQNQWWNLGLYFVQGFAKGIENNLGIAQNAAWSLGGTALNSTSERLDEHSPSKEAMKLGNYFTEGLAIGITELSGRVKAATSDLGDTAMFTAKNALSGFSSLLIEDIDPNPTIRPVLDMTDVMTGLGQMDSALHDRTVTFGAATSEMMARDVGGNTKKDYSELINSINNRIDELNDNLMHMQVVLDTGIMVGEMATQMDNQLGTIAVYKGRGN